MKINKDKQSNASSNKEKKRSAKDLYIMMNEDKHNKILWS